MEYKFSDRVLTLKPSAIREIFKYAADPTVVSLSAGNPSPEAFPVKEIAEISARIFAEISPDPSGIFVQGTSRRLFSLAGLWYTGSGGAPPERSVFHEDRQDPRPGRVCRLCAAL